MHIPIAERTVSTIEELLDSPYWVIDLLPMQVPAEGGGRYFAVESHFLTGDKGLELRRRFADVLLKLNCYYDFMVYRDGSKKGKLNPAPAKLEQWVLKDKGTINIVLEDEDALIAVQESSTCMTVYNANHKLLALIHQIAAGNGLYVWAP